MINEYPVYAREAVKLEYLGYIIYQGKLKMDIVQNAFYEKQNHLPPRAKSVPFWVFVSSTNDSSLTSQPQTIHLINFSVKEHQKSLNESICN